MNKCKDITFVHSEMLKRVQKWLPPGFCLEETLINSRLQHKDNGSDIYVMEMFW